MSTRTGAGAKALRRDLPDLVAFLAGTGARIAGACALRWSSLDLAEGTATLGPVVIREKGKGLRIQGDGKSDSSTRTIELPARRSGPPACQVEAEPNEWDVVFPSPRGRLQDPVNTCNDVSEPMTDAGHEWATCATTTCCTARSSTCSRSTSTSAPPGAAPTGAAPRQHAGRPPAGAAAEGLARHRWKPRVGAAGRRARAADVPRDPRRHPRGLGRARGGGAAPLARTVSDIVGVQVLPADDTVADQT